MVCIIMTFLLFLVKNNKKDVAEPIISVTKKSPGIKRVEIAGSRSFLKKRPLGNFKFKDSIPEPEFKNLVMLGEIGKFGSDNFEGKIIRSLRFQNLTREVERRYNLPDNILLAMIVQESSGADLLPNGLGDGGFGLCHMQPIVAREFGLYTYKACSAMVCNGKDKRSCLRNGKRVDHASELSVFILKNRLGRKGVYHVDDRLHPIYNIDAAGRMIAYHIAAEKQLPGMGPLRTAICRYAGSTNYCAYWDAVRMVMKKLNNPAYIKKVEALFNNSNKNLQINGKPGNFQKYIEVSQQQLYNYGLSEYEKLPYWSIKNTDIVQKTYKKYI